MMSAAEETILANARLVLGDEIMTGSIDLKGGRIAAIDAGRTVPTTALDLEGDYLLPGLVDLHTDNIEKHHQPRKGVFWDPMIAALSHDVQVVAAGITRDAR